MRLIARASALSVGFSVALVSSGLTADLPARFSPRATQVSWAGLYVGGHVGAGWGTTENDGTSNDFGADRNSHGTHTVDGVVGGFQIGYNWQRGYVVYGVEADFGASGIRGFGICGRLGANCSTEVDWLATVTGRLGWSVDRALVYVKGGAAWARRRYDVSFGDVPALTDSASETRLGWLLGTGIEFALLPHWSGRIEYSYIDFGHRSFVFDSPALGLDNPNVRIRQVQHLVRVGANYHFNGGLLAATPSRAMPVKAPSLLSPASSYDWSGFYVGGHLGAGWGSKGQSTDEGGGFITRNSHSVHGFLGGLQAGHNWQRDSLVFGIEADASAADISGRSVCYRDPNCVTRVEWLGTVAGRIGWSVGRALPYLKGGFAWASDHYDVNLSGTSTSASETRWGWMVGTGIEYALAANWSARIEYNYLDLGTRTVFFADSNAVGLNAPDVEMRQRMHLVKLGVNYRPWGVEAHAGNNATGMPTKAPVHARGSDTIWHWTGTYVGGHAGAGWGATEQSMGRIGVPGIAVSSHTVSGFLGGVQAGYNWQHGRWVLGVEADASASGLKGQGICGRLAFHNCFTQIDWLASVTGRIGWTIDRALIYAKGGAAWVHDKNDIDYVVSAGPAISASDTRWGWVFGAGLEYGLTANWSAKAEYNFLDFGTQSLVFANSASVDIQEANIPIRQRLHLIKFGANYRFGGPIAARY